MDKNCILQNYRICSTSLNVPSEKHVNVKASVATNIMFEQSLPIKSSFMNLSLVYHMQPTILKDFIGQNHILGPNTYLYELLKSSEIPSMILWGPPGCGKTSLANIIKEICFCNSHKYDYQQITSVNELELPSNRNKKLVVYLDEIQKLNKPSQRLLIPYIEKDNVTLIGSTNENPSFFLISKLTEHCRIILMNKLRKEDVLKIIWKALAHLKIGVLDDVNTLKNYSVIQISSLCIKNSTIEWLATTCDGDARIALNNLELILQNHSGNQKILDIKTIKNEIKKKHLAYDHNGEEHHNIISAMHESIKGYNDNASLYWTSRMLMGGEDPLFIARRLVRAASEDTGLADVNALKLAMSAMVACRDVDKNDTPDIFLAQCAVYLARAPTNKKVFIGLDLAKKLIRESNKNQPEVPVHLCNIPPKLEELFQDGRKSYMPIGMEDVNFL